MYSTCIWFAISNFSLFWFLSKINWNFSEKGNEMDSGIFKGSIKKKSFNFLFNTQTSYFCRKLTAVWYLPLNNNNNNFIIQILFCFWKFFFIFSKNYTFFQSFKNQNSFQNHAYESVTHVQHMMKNITVDIQLSVWK